jgi:2-polyprenyl-3-methyl-5-hydroxy-6-metoxy-1,4-benzoquinol methylase
MEMEFDYQWKNLPSPFIDLNENRVKELLKFTGLPPDFFKGKKVLDAGCGSGRYTYAMQQLGADVDSIDVSSEAIMKCKEINPKACVKSLFEAEGEYDFILSWGVLHHTHLPYSGFAKLVGLLNPNGVIHIMVYRKENQEKYEEYRKIFQTLNKDQKIALCKKLGKNNIHGWYDALNPKYNFSYTEKDIVTWFWCLGLKNIKSVTPRPSNINVNGVKP